MISFVRQRETYEDKAPNSPIQCPAHEQLVWQALADVVVAAWPLEVDVLLQPPVVGVAARTALISRRASVLQIPAAPLYTLSRWQVPSYRAPAVEIKTSEDPARANINKHVVYVLLTGRLLGGPLTTALGSSGVRLFSQDSGAFPAQISICWIRPSCQSVAGSNYQHFDSTEIHPVVFRRAYCTAHMRPPCEGISSDRENR